MYFNFQCIESQYNRPKTGVIPMNDVVITNQYPLVQGNIVIP